MKLVVDASVVVKWILPDEKLETHSAEALALLAKLRDGEATVLQPLHWLVEVAAVVTRLRPAIADEAIDLLAAMELPTVSDVQVIQRASALARDLNHHLFDTLYHATALEHGRTLVTADDVYFRKARHLGAIVRLAAFHSLADD